jgi:hypothetical protein
MVRVILALALPVAVIMIVVTITVLQTWVAGTGLCATWISVILPVSYCR